MVTIETFRELLGWCTVINIGILAITSILLSLLRGPISNIRANLFGLDQIDVSRAYFQYLAQYKIAILFLNIVPYIGLKLMT